MYRKPVAQKLKRQLFGSALVLCLHLSTLLTAATYYVDSRKGNDTNPGTAPETAWKILERVNKTSCANIHPSLNY